MATCRPRSPLAHAPMFRLLSLLGLSLLLTSGALAQADETDGAPLIPRSELPDLGGTAAPPVDEDDSEGTGDGGGGGDTTGRAYPVEPPAIQRDHSRLPDVVQRTRERLLEAARSGRIEALRKYIGIGETATEVSIGGLDGDPIAHLKSNSGDEDGYEILAILIEILEAGYVHLDRGTDTEMYVWPWFVGVPLERMTPEQKVELFQVLTAGDVEDTVASGGYVFYRLGIRPDGEWAFFLAGD